jgi:hypothetical protein
MRLKEQLELQSNIEVPWNVWRMFGNKSKNGTIEIRGDQASFGEDFGSKEELRVAIEWYVDQLGGKVKWGK